MHKKHPSLIFHWTIHNKLRFKNSIAQSLLILIQYYVINMLYLIKTKILK